MKEFRYLNKECSDMTFGDFLDKIKLIEADLNTQSENRWADSNKSRFIQSLILGKAPSKFIFANVSSCLASATDQIDHEYYKNWVDKGILLLNIDSWNRTNTIKEFAEGLVIIPAGVYKIGKKTYRVIKNENDKYDSMPSGLRDHLRSVDISADEYLNARKVDIPDIFCNINDGVNLNADEKRNAILCHIGDDVRELADSHKDNLYIAAGGKVRRKVDNLVASCAYTFFYGLDNNVNKKNLDDMYKIETSVANLQSNRFKTLFNRFMKVVGNNLNSTKRPQIAFDCWNVYMTFINNGYSLQEENYDQFVNSLVSISIQLSNDKNTPYEYGTDRHGNVKTRTYERLLASKDHDMNKKRLQMVTERMDTTIFTKLDARRTFTDEERYIAAETQGWKTPNGTEIDRGRLLTDDYHADHDKPFILGGGTIQENCVIMTKTENLSKGARI